MHSYDLYHIQCTHHVRTSVLEMVQSRNFQISKNRMSLLISAVRFVVFPCTWDLSNISSRMHCQSCQENLPVTLRLHTFKDLLRQRYKGPLSRENTKMRLLQRIKSWMHPPPSSADLQVPAPSSAPSQCIAPLPGPPVYCSLSSSSTFILIYSGMSKYLALLSLKTL